MLSGLLIVAMALLVWWLERKSSTTQIIVKSALLGLRLALEAIILVVLLHATFMLCAIMLTGTGVHIAMGLLGIAFSIFITMILVRDALGIRIKLNDLDAARVAPPTEQDRV